MQDFLAIEVEPSRAARALGLLLIGALAIAPAVVRTGSSPRLASDTACELTRTTVRPRASIQTRTHALNPRYLQRESRTR
jgi:hypothetical protein